VIENTRNKNFSRVLFLIARVREKKGEVEKQFHFGNQNSQNGNVLGHRYVDAPVLRCSGAPVLRCAGAPVRRCVAALACRRADVPMRRRADVPTCRRADAPVRRCVSRARRRYVGAGVTAGYTRIRAHAHAYTGGRAHRLAYR